MYILLSLPSINFLMPKSSDLVNCLYNFSQCLEMSSFQKALECILYVSIAPLIFIEKSYVTTATFLLFFSSMSDLFQLRIM